MEHITYIYILKDPRDPAVKYVGKTIHRISRAKSHRSPNGESHCARWLKRLRSHGLQAIFEVIEAVPCGGDWASRERFWIADYKLRGAELCNMSAGGEGTFGPRLSAEAKERLRQRFLGRPIPPEQRALISKSLTGKKQSPETVAKRKSTIVAKFGRQGCFSDAHRKAVSEGLKGRIMSPETREKLRQANLGKKYSAETIAKRLTGDVRKRIAESMRKHHAMMTPEEKAQFAAKRSKPSPFKGTKRGPLPEEQKAKIAAALKAHTAALTLEQRQQRMKAAQAANPCHQAAA